MYKMFVKSVCYSKKHYFNLIRCSILKIKIIALKNKNILNIS